VLSEIGERILKDRYAAVLSDGQKENWHQLAKRVASGLVQKERIEERDNLEKTYFAEIFMRRAIPAGRILRGAGIPDTNLGNCFVIPVEDSKESIAALLQNIYLISCHGGGTGVNVSKIRPWLEMIGDHRGFAPGVISVLSMIDGVGKHSLSGGLRRAALLSVLDISHPDIIDYLTCKKDRNVLNNFNISVNITPEFTKAVVKDSPWELRFRGKKYNRYKVVHGEKSWIITAPTTKEAEERSDFLSPGADTTKLPPLSARDLWHKIIAMALENGEPGILNLSLCNEMNNGYYFEEIQGVNPCAEFTGSDYSSCILGSVNLCEFVSEGNILWDNLKHTVRCLVRMLDSAIDITTYPLPSIKEATIRNRSIGLGTMGFHHLLMELGISYGSDECLELIDELFSFIRDEAYDMSSDLAREKGTFPEYKSYQFCKSKFFATLPRKLKAKIKKYGMRNVRLLAQAPNGTTHQLIGVSPTIEPIPGRVTMRNDALGERVVVDPKFKELVKQGRDVSHVNSSFDLDPEDHLKVQAAVQNYIDNSISKTILVRHDWKPEHVDVVSYMEEKLMEYLPDLKGTTIYREGSRAQQIISPVSEEDEAKYIKEALAETEEIVCRSGQCEL